MIGLTHSLKLWLIHLTQPCQRAILPDGKFGFVRNVFYAMVFEVFDENGVLIGNYNQVAKHFSENGGFIVNDERRTSKTEMLPGIAWLITRLSTSKKEIVTLVVQN